ncbi:NAD(P)-dependent oxidoreductase [Alloacidobacterium sp.]|uniref:NAD(P)-dependent oxidoreductase n=1 Tax=Alloacidobacterium sp. TaxID=2951999 RepID=UPI002D5FED55|nr:NAD(P)-dependent oxidoreductase [Alloacidobacterium sp.]HYK34311.1 NAD(P)-dependent oxidoreductase [Alloacidobacterium sp.]
MPHPKPGFRVTLSADFCDEKGRLIFPDIGLSVLDSVPEVSYGFLKEYRSEYSSEQLMGCDVLISLKPKITAQSLQGISQLCAIGRCGVGYDNVDLNACTEHGIAVFITPGGVVRPVAESIVLFVLALSHNLVMKDRVIREGRWAESTRRLGREPRQRVVGTIGLGNIASEAVRLLGSFDVRRFLAFDPYVSPERAALLGVELVALDELLHMSDYVLVNCPLTPQTRGLLGKQQFALMKPDAVLINTARGPIVDEAALIDALKNGRIAAAALDVFEREPLSADSPLLRMENVILSSHSIAWTEELFRDMGRIDCEGALAIYRGEVPENVVNAQVLNQPNFRMKLAKYKAAFAAEGRTA